MAHDVLIAGALFPDVPSVQLPDSQQQWHSFTDVSDTTAAAADVAQGKQFYDAAGVLTQGTASGGGGSSWTLLAHREYSITEQPSTTSTQVDSFSLGPTAYSKDVIIYSVARKRDFVKSASQHRGTDTFFLNAFKANREADPLTMANRGMFNFYVNSSGKWATAISGSSSAGGLYINEMSYGGQLTVCVRYIASWGSLIGTYDFDIYALDWPSGAKPFDLPTT